MRFRGHKFLVFTTVCLVLIVGFWSIAPAQSEIQYGRWRDINPTQYAAESGAAPILNSIYIRSGGSGAIGAGDGWAVGGDGGPVIAHYDGFSWHIMPSGAAGTIYHGTHFCTSPGAPGVGLCSPNGDGSDGWIVGEGPVNPPLSPTGGVALYWDGSLLTQITVPSPVTILKSVFLVCHTALPQQSGSGCPSGGVYTNGLAYAVGSDGTNGLICSFSGNPKATGAAWTCGFSSPLTNSFNGIYMYDQSGNLGGVAVGNNGYVSIFSGSSWGTPTQIAAGVDFKSVFVDANNPVDAIAVGTGGNIVHLSGSAWTLEGTFGPQDLNSVFLVSTSEGWAVGNQATILHTTSLPVGWTPVSNVNALQTGVGTGIDLFGVSFTNSGNGWASGTQGVILQTSNSQCGSGPTVNSPCWGGSSSITQTPRLNTVFEVGSSDAWAGGFYDQPSGINTMIHWDGNKWHRAALSTPAGVPTDIFGISMQGSGSGWAVGTDDNGLGTALDAKAIVLQWTGSTSWGTGTGGSQVLAGCTCGLRSVFMVSSNEVWAVGTGGNSFQRQSSGTWSPIPTGTGVTLHSVFINNPGSSFGGWAVGDTGTVLRLDESQSPPVWNLNPILGITTSDYFGVYFTDSNHGWIVGSSATILTTTDGGHSWSGGQNQVAGAPSGTVLRSVFIDNAGSGSGKGDGWAVGYDGSSNAVLAHWDGQTWIDVPMAPPLASGANPFGLGLYSVYLTSPVDGFAVGNGVAGLATPLAGIFHLDPPNPPTVGTTSSTTSVETTSSTTASSSSATSTSSTTSSSQASTVTTASTTTTEVSTSIATSLVSTTAVVTQTVTTSSSATTPLVLPGIPGFPWESIILGVILGTALLGLLRQARRKTS